MILIVRPSAASRINEQQIASGIEDGDDDRAAPRAKKEQDHQGGRGWAAMPPSVSTPVSAEVTKTDWSKRGSTFNSGGSWERTRGSLSFDALDHVDRRGASVLEHAEQRSLLAIQLHDIGLRRVAVADLCDVADEDGRTVGLLDRKIVELVQEAGAAVEQHIVFAVANLDRARGKDDILRVDGVADLGGRDVERLALLEIEIDRDKPLLSTVGKGNRRAAHFRQRVAG